MFTFLTVLVCVFRYISCGNSSCAYVFEKRQFLIESPNYPKEYPSKVSCTYTLKGPECALSYNVQFLDFNLEQSPGCVKDRLEVGDQDAVCGHKTGIKSYETFGSLTLRFVSDSSGSEKGFRLLVTRQPCKTDEILTTSAEDVYFTTPSNYNRDSFPTTTKSCCKESYSSKRFYLTSPSFPYTSKTQTDCSFKIFKTNNDICRLRLNFIFFWTGCDDGFLEIDGRRVCGCATGRKLISSFDSVGESFKTLRFKGVAVASETFSGFVVEVVQDECPVKYGGRLRDSFVELQRADLIKEKVYDDFPQMVKEVYFFGPPEVDGSTEVIKELEETTELDVLDVRGVDNEKCSAWGFNDLARLHEDPLWKEASKCSSSSTTSREKRCVVLNSPRGYFQSPGYPVYYPQNLDLCFRFWKLPGFCGIRMYMADFSLQDSWNCERDYFMMAEKYKYCGQRLYNTISTFDLRHKDFEDATFVTDGSYCGRGFRGLYEQIACQDEGYPVPPSVYTTTETAQIPCHKRFTDDNFLISVYGSERDCNFEVIKSRPDVCKLEVEVLTFEVVCGSESLLIKDKMFCGVPTAKVLVFDFTETVIKINYRRFNTYSESRGLKVALEVRQISGCNPNQYPEVPAERFGGHFQSTDGVVTIITNNNPDAEICGFVKNVTQSVLPEAVCTTLLRDDRISECYRVAENSTNVATGMQLREMECQ